MTEARILDLYSKVLHRRDCEGCPRLDTFRPSLMNEDPCRKVMLIFESPGGKGDEDESSLKKRKTTSPELLEVLEAEIGRMKAIAAQDVAGTIKWSRKSFHHYWVRSKQKYFFRRFFEILAESRVIDLNAKNVNSYIDGMGYWNDFFVVDAALCPGDRKQTIEAAIHKCGVAFLKPQIKWFKEASNPKLIVPFGSYALSSLMGLLREPYNYLPEKPTSMAITDCKGYVFQYDNFAVLPLEHVSRLRFMKPRESYFDPLRLGLNHFCKTDVQAPMSKSTLGKSLSSVDG